MRCFDTAGSMDNKGCLGKNGGGAPVTKAELVERVSDHIKLTKKQTEVIVNTLFTSITDALTHGNKVELRGFGSFRVRRRQSRDGRNPKTGQSVYIPPK